MTVWENYPQAVTGTWGDVERRARYLYESADEQSDLRGMAEAVLVLLRAEYSRVGGYGIADDFPALWKLAQQHDFRERLGGDRDPVSCEVDAALRELWDARRSKAENSQESA